MVLAGRIVLSPADVSWIKRQEVVVLSTPKQVDEFGWSKDPPGAALLPSREGAFGEDSRVGKSHQRSVRGLGSDFIPLSDGGRVDDRMIGEIVDDSRGD